MNGSSTPVKHADWHWIWRSLMLRKRQVATVCVLTVLIYAAGLALPVFTQIAIDSFSAGTNRDLLLWLGVGALLAVIVEAWLINLRQRYVIDVGSLLDKRVSLKTFAQVMRSRLHASGVQAGDVINRFQRTGKIRSFALELIPQALFEIGDAIISLIVMCYYDMIIGVVVFFANVFSASILRKQLTMYYEAAKAHFDSDGQRQNYLSETINGLLTIKMLAIENRRMAGWKRLTLDVIAALRELSERSRRFLVGSDIATRMITLIVLFLGCYRILTGAITLGDLLALQLLATRISAPILQSSEILRQYQEVKIAIEELARFAAEPSEKATRQYAYRALGNDGVEVRDLSLKYPGAAPPALQKVSFKLPSSGFVALVGRNGSGKSSLIRLLLGLHPDYEGEALVGGHSVRHYDPRSLRAAIGIVNQDTVLFAGTIRENLSFGPSLVADEAMWRALDFSEAKAFVDRLPDGLDTRLEENGRNLSGGERQRLSIARAVIRSPKMIFLDEPTAFLDAEAALALERKMIGLSKSSLVVLVTHHLASIRDAERILVLDHGVLVGDGRHEVLFDGCPEYRKLWTDYRRDMGPYRRIGIES